MDALESTVSDILYFNLIVNDETRTISCRSYPRVGDHVSIDGEDILIDKVTWMSVKDTLSEQPFMIGSVPYDPASGMAGSVNIEDELMAVIANNYVGDKKINAIKEVRAHTNWGLKEAKNCVDDVWLTLDSVNVPSNAKPVIRKTLRSHLAANPSPQPRHSS